MCDRICKVLDSLGELVYYTISGILMIMLLPTSLICYTLVGIVKGLDSAYRDCYREMYDMIRLILIRKKVKIVTLKEGQEYDEHLGAYYPDGCVCTVCNCEKCECGEKDE